MELRLFALCAAVAIGFPAAAETVYKYRDAGGRTVYSNRPLPALELIEAFEYRFPEPGAADPDLDRRARESDRRIRQHLIALEQAWVEVQEASRALAGAEERLLAGAEPMESERRLLGGPAVPAPPAVGGPLPSAPPAVGGPSGTRRGGGSQAEYRERQQTLEADVEAARQRLAAAWRRYNSLR